MAARDYAPCPGVAASHPGTATPRTKTNRTSSPSRRLAPRDEPPAATGDTAAAGGKQTTIMVIVLLVTMPRRRLHWGKVRACDMASPEIPPGLFATLLFRIGAVRVARSHQGAGRPSRPDESQALMDIGWARDA